MPLSISELYKSRCTQDEHGNLVPTFWRPQPIAYQRPCLFADQRNTFDLATELQILNAARRCIALGLQLEVPVGQFVRAQTDAQLPKIAHIRELLMSAVADEGRHYRGFHFAEQAYGTVEDAHAVELSRRWFEVATATSPIAAAGWLEAGVFLSTLGFMRIACGPSLAELALRIAEDESRHVATNRAVTQWLRIEVPQSVRELIADTIRYAIGTCCFVASGTVCDAQFFVDCGLELLDTNKCKRLDDLCNAIQHDMPFEKPNNELYTRETENGTTSY
jgi:hypothetical protein